jgi:hypothetical protein
VQAKTRQIRLAQTAATGYSGGRRAGRPAQPPDVPMTDLYTSAQFLHGVAVGVRDALAALDRQEAALDESFATPTPHQSWAESLGRLEDTLTGWQGILGDVAERVRAAQDDLAALDADLKRSLNAFATARKHLQGSGREAGGGSGS